MIKNLMKKKRKKGFTLIELIIVIAIIAILATVALPKFAAIRENANVKADIANAKSIQNEVIALIGDDKILTYQSYSLKSTVDAATTTVAGLQNTPKLKARGVKNGDFFVEIDLYGTVNIYVDNSGSAGKRIYPDGIDPYNIK